MIVVLMFALGMTSCNSFLKGFYGIMKIKLVNENTIAKNAKKKQRFS